MDQSVLDKLAAAEERVRQLEDLMERSATALSSAQRRADSAEKAVSSGAPVPKLTGRKTLAKRRV